MSKSVSITGPRALLQYALFLENILATAARCPRFQLLVVYKVTCDVEIWLKARCINYNIYRTDVSLLYGWNPLVTSRAILIAINLRITFAFFSDSFFSPATLQKA